MELSAFSLIIFLLLISLRSYRQAPDFIYPTQFNDCYNVAIGVLNTGATYGVDVSRVGIIGDSAGGNLAAAVTHYLAEVSEMHCKTQYLKAQVCIIIIIICIMQVRAKASPCGHLADHQGLRGPLDTLM